MTAIEHTGTDPYNAAAIDIAAELDALRRPRAEPTVTRSIEELMPPHDNVPVGIAREYEAMGNQPVTDGLAAEAAEVGASFEHLGLTLGTVIHGIDLNQDLDARTIALIRSTLLERKVIFFRDQHLDEATQVAFGRHFGELDAFPFGAPGEDPYILEIRHHDQSPGSENGWHTDVTWMEHPSLGSIAQCVTAPPIGGDTLFADSHAAWRGLKAELQAQVLPLHGINDYRIFLGSLRGRAASDELVQRIKERISFGVTHPLCRVHPETGKPALYIHGGFLRHDSLHNPATGEELDAKESRSIVRQLLAQHARPEYQCRFAWTEGSIAFWDNRAVQHYAASDYWPHRRVLRRVTVRGDRPVAWTGCSAAAT